MDFKSAEAVTKFLRSKGTSITDIVDVSRKLINDELDVYLPNKLSFLLDLLLDRLNDPKSKFRENISTWELFNDVWSRLDSDPKTRARSFQSFRFGEAFLGALTSVKTENREAYITTLTLSLNSVRLTTSITVPAEATIKILSIYLQNLTHIDGNHTSKLKDICSFFRASLPLEKQTPKLTSTFVTSALPPALELLSSTQTEVQPLLTLIRKIVFAKDSLPQLKQHTESLIKLDIIPSSLIEFYKLIVDTISKQETVLLEDIFALITKTYPACAEDLLGYLSVTKRTLSPSFIQMVYETETQSATRSWKLIHSLLRLDIEVGVSHIESIMEELEVKRSELYIDIGKEIIDAHVRARDLKKFFLVWMKCLEKDGSVWGSQEFGDVVAKSVLTLSGSQLQQLIEEIQKSNSSAKFVVLSTIVQGLFLITDKKIIAVARDTLKSTFDIQANESDDAVWSLRYQLLCLFEDIVTQDQCLALAKQKAKKPSLNQFYTMFRIRELYDIDIESLVSKFVKYLKSSSNKSDLLTMIFERWFVLVDSIFKQDQIDQIVSSLLEDPELALTLVKGNNLLFEQSHITESLITSVAKDVTSPAAVDLLNLIPIQCYPRRTKAPLLDALYNEVVKSTAQNEALLTTVAHILQTPTFKSKVETDINAIKSIVSLAPKSTLFATIWTHHIANIKEEQNLRFITSTVSSVTADLQVAGDVLIPAFFMAKTILSHPPSLDLTSLQSTFIDASKKLLNSYMFAEKEKIDEITWLLNSLYAMEMDTESFEVLKTPLKLFGKKIQDAEFVETKSALFLVLSKFGANAENVEYFESLYLVLRETGVPQSQLYPGLRNVIKSLGEEQFVHESQQVLRSFDGSFKMDYIVEVLCAYLHGVDKSNSQAQKFVIQSLSTLLMHFSSLEPASLTLTVETFRTLLVESAWCFTQYTVELFITFLSRTADGLKTHTAEGSVELFTTITHCMSNIILFHRYRLSNRHHIVLSVFTSLLASLTKRRTPGPLQHSKIAAESFQRLVTNLCEPSTSNMKEKHDDSLNSSASIIKRSLRKHVYVLLLTYIHLSLKFSFEPEVREALLPGIFSVFDVLSQSELVLVSASLDYAGRVYYRTVYDEYKKVGKWKTD